jgi:hypothetical protein
MYQVSHPAKSSSRTHYLAVNPVLEESDLSPMNDSEQAALFGTANVIRLAADKLDEHFVRRQEIVGWIALPLALVLVIEALSGAWQARRKVRREASR